MFTAGLFFIAVIVTGWAVSSACSSYRGTFRPADVVCDVPHGRELAFIVVQHGPSRGMSAEQVTKRSICRMSSDVQWQLACDLPSDREFIVSLSSSRLPRKKCRLFIDCPVHY